MKADQYYQPFGSVAANRWFALLMALLAQVTVSVVAQGVPTLAPFVQADLGLNRAQAGLLGSALVTGMILALALAGWAVDQYGERIVLVAGNLMVGGFALVVADTSRFPMALATLAVAGVGTAAATPAGSKAVMEWFPAQQRGLAMGVRQTGIPIGGALAAAVLPLVASIYGWRTGLGVAGVAALLGGVATWGFYREAGGERVRAFDGDSGRFNPFETLNREVVLMGLVGALLPLGQFCLLTYLALYLKETRGLPLTTGAGMLIGAQMAGAVGRIVLGMASDGIFAGRRKPVLVLAGLISAALAVALGLTAGFLPMALVGLLVLIMGFFAIGWHGVWVTLLAELAGPRRQGRTLGTAMTMMQMGIAAGPPVFGWLVDRTGLWWLSWSLLGVALAAGSILVLAVREAGQSRPCYGG